MRRSARTCVFSFIVILWVAVPYNVGVAADTPHRVNAVFVSRESSIHTSLSNRDAYVIRIITKRGSVFTARMVDEYPAYGEGFPASSLTEGESFSVALRRMPYCDGGFNKMEDDESLRCFEAVHGSWKTPKSQPKDEWWQ